MKIAIGTNSRYKVNAILKALHGLDFDFEYVFDAANSEISDQPMKVGETKQGSINRARNILTKHPESDIGLGVEFGYEPIDGKYHMVCWASIITKDGKTFSEQSSTLELPKRLLEALLKGISVGDILDHAFDDITHKHRHRVLQDLLHKRRVITECTENVMLRYLLDEEFY
jgi:non-canonical (house-cleaning) NTP pyrophosphatase